MHFRSLALSGTYLWEFVPNNVIYIDGTYPGMPNPHVKFTQAGDYDVTLTVNSVPVTYLHYITVSEYPSFELSLSDGNPQHYIAISISPSIDIASNDNNPVFINHIQFGIMWDKTAVNGNKLDFDMVCETDEIARIYQIRQEGWPAPSPVPHNTHSDGDVANWDYRNFENYTNVIIKIPSTGWTAGESYPIAILKVFARTPGGHLSPEGEFYIIPPGDPDDENHNFTRPEPNNPSWFRRSYNPKIELEHTPFFDSQILDGPFNPIVFPIPTALSGYYWHGNGRNNNDGYDKHSWNYNENWRTGCGDSDITPEFPPGYLDDCVIPDVEEYYNQPPYYPRNDNADDPGSTAHGNNVSILGGRIEWMQDVTASGDCNLTIWGNLSIGYSSPPIGGYDNDILTNSVHVYDNGHIEIGGDPDLIGNPVGYYADLNVYESGGINIYAGGSIDANFDTHLNADTAFVIHSDSDGTGSFINTGSVSYGNHRSV